MFTTAAPSASVGSRAEVRTSGAITLTSKVRASTSGETSSRAGRGEAPSVLALFTSRRTGPRRPAAASTRARGGSGAEAGARRAPTGARGVWGPARPPPERAARVPRGARPGRRLEAVVPAGVDHEVPAPIGE